MSVHTNSLSEAISQNKFRQAVCEVLKKNGIDTSSLTCGKSGVPTDSDLLDKLAELGKSYSVVNAILKSGDGIKIDKVDNGKTYRISANGNAKLGADITHSGLAIELERDTPIHQAITKLIDAIDRAKSTAIATPTIKDARMVKANSNGEHPWINGSISGVISGLSPQGWYLSLNLVSQKEPMLVDMAGPLSDVYRAAVKESRANTITLIKKTMDKHLSTYHTVVQEEELPEIDDPFAPIPGDKERQDSCPTEMGFLAKLEALLDGDKEG